jgi:hypothetical protein
MAHGDETVGRRLASPWLGRERLAGLVLVVFGAIMLVGGAQLPFLTSDGIGSGLAPRILAILVVALGLLQIGLSWSNPGPTTGSWSLGRALPVLAGVVLFAASIRGFTLGPIDVPELGLSVAAPLAIVASGLADRSARLGELIVFALVLTAVCIAIFRYALGLSVPVAPWLIGY